MDPLALIDSLDRFGRTLPSVVMGISDLDARWHPPPEGQHWSILEIVTHLCDEEVEDFRTRLRLTLEEPEREWPSIDPQGWVLQRRYNQGSLETAAERFVRERKQSIAWLRGLGPQDWQKAHHHPKIGAIRAGDLLAAWAAHDALHLRQIARRMHQLTQRNAEPFSTRYAGEW